MLALCLPGVLYFVAFFYVPLLGNVIAFKDYAPFLGIAGSPWVGLDNFVMLLEEPEFWSAVGNTLQITALQLVLYFPAPIALALLLNSLVGHRVKRFVQTVVYLPHFLSWVVVVAMFQQVIGGAGTVSSFLNSHGITIGNLMSNADTFKLLVTAQVIWKDCGWGTIIFLAAITAIDMSHYEAAAIDGADWKRRLWHVTLPGIRSVILMMLILRLGDILSVGFEQMVLQREAVGAGASEVIDTYVYYHGIRDGDWGMSTAAGLMKGLIGAALIYAANKLAHRFGEQGIYR
ncbi:MAG: sugar ABC transporter permease [Nonomuraea sp.]|nr:sugar ABC transporter permease [Nonomuraea sp.]NUP61566.1 sugar ABC transporter permease [Nonomuraea sp.]NUP82419.1 sugar ABC transporter permease [Nonomuraea sp.]NUS04621.1 sugar ABC transporter permease [Nonomuraea sp.]NUT38647.1 sugar ABC transporter permease [Thermoactinospora sp.]